MNYLKKLKRRYFFLKIFSFFSKEKKVIYEDLLSLTKKWQTFVETEEKTLDEALTFLNNWLIAQFNLCRGTRNILIETSNDKNFIDKWDKFVNIFAKEIVKVSDMRKEVLYGIIKGS